MKDSVSEGVQKSGTTDVSYEPPAIEVLGDLLEITQGTGIDQPVDAAGASV